MRLYQGDFDAETRYEPSPAQVYARYAEAGARWLHVVDLDGAKDGASAQTQLIGELASPGRLRVHAGGGVRDAAAVERLLATGVERVVIGSAAIRDPLAVLSWLDRHGPERIVLAVDVSPPDPAAEVPPIVLTHGWRRSSQQSLWSVLAPFAAAGLRHVLCTDVERDGALRGPNLALYAEARRRFPQLAWQASGGIRDRADLAALDALGMEFAVVGRSLLEGSLTLAEVATYLPGA